MMYCAADLGRAQARIDPLMASQAGSEKGENYEDPVTNFDDPNIMAPTCRAAKSECILDALSVLRCTTEKGVSTWSRNGVSPRSGSIRAGIHSWGPSNLSSGGPVEIQQSACAGNSGWRICGGVLQCLRTVARICSLGHCASILEKRTATNPIPEDSWLLPNLGTNPVIPSRP